MNDLWTGGLIGFSSGFGILVAKSILDFVAHRLNAAHDASIQLKNALKKDAIDKRLRAIEHLNRRLYEVQGHLFLFTDLRAGLFEGRIDEAESALKDIRHLQEQVELEAADLGDLEQEVIRVLGLLHRSAAKCRTAGPVREQGYPEKAVEMWRQGSEELIDVVLPLVRELRQRCDTLRRQAIENIEWAPTLRQRTRSG